MGKSKKKSNKRKSNWTPPKGASAYFSPASDYEFQKKHPVGYFFLALLGIAALVAPMAGYVYYTIFVLHNNSGWLVLGWIGSFIIGIGLFNFVAIIIKQYLGHLVSVLSFLLGGIMIAVSLRLI